MLKGVNLSHCEMSFSLWYFAFFLSHWRLTIFSEWLFSYTFFQVRRLPVGDGIWIARHKQFGREYVLDFIVERKRIDDLCSSIRDNRYKDQKLRLLVVLLPCRMDDFILGTEMVTLILILVQFWWWALLRCASKVNVQRLSCCFMVVHYLFVSFSLEKLLLVRLW